MINIRTCPLGHQCEQCLWFTRIRGYNALTGDDQDITDCAINTLNILLTKDIQGMNSVGAAIESFRNEMVSQQSSFLGLVRDVADNQKLLEN